MRHLGERNEGENSHSCEHDGGNQHDHSRPNIGAEERDGRQPATVTEKGEKIVKQIANR